MIFSFHTRPAGASLCESGNSFYYIPMIIQQDLKLYDNGAVVTLEYVFQSTETNRVENLADCLREIRDEIEPGGRYDKERIHILVEPGDKQPDFKGCPRCGNYMDFDMGEE